MWAPGTIEAVRERLAEVPLKGATIVVGQPPIKGTTGGPNRIMALV